MKDERDQIIKQNNPNPYRDKVEKRMNLEAGWYCDKEKDDREEIKGYMEDIEKLQRVAKNTKEHGPVLASFIEENREREAEEVKENVKKTMERGMLSEEEEKAFREKFGLHKKEYDAPICEVICDAVDYVSTGEDEKFIQAETVKENSFTDIIWKLDELHRRKNHDYGNAAHESYKEFGLISYVIRLNDKMKRLKSLTKPGAEQQVADEKIEDTLMDLAAYAIMAIESLHSDD